MNGSTPPSARCSALSSAGVGREEWLNKALWTGFMQQAKAVGAAPGRLERTGERRRGEACGSPGDV